MRWLVENVGDQFVLPWLPQRLIREFCERIAFAADAGMQQAFCSPFQRGYAFNEMVITSGFIAEQIYFHGQEVRRESCCGKTDVCFEEVAP